MIGSNVPTHPSQGGPATMFQYSDRWGLECAQTYFTLSRRWNVPTLRAEDISNFRLAWQKSNVKEIVAHVPLIVNLASPLNVTRQKSRDRLSYELSRANDLGIHFLVLHPGYYGKSTKATGTEHLVDGLNHVLGQVKDSATKILLETMAGQGTALGTHFEEIASIIEKVEKNRSLGVCLDTCHVFAAGYDLRGYRGCEEILEKFNCTIGIEKLGTIHLNDSKMGLGSKVDRHMAIGKGKMGLQVFHRLLKDPRFLDTPKVLELPTKDSEMIRQQLEFLRKLQTTPGPVSEPRDVRSQSTLDDALSKTGQN
jgi:deoxyribonuclease-4